MKTIYLIGFMGSGKSTAGKLLHEALEVPYLDTDQMIVDKYGDIASIFQQEGEKQFRLYESEMLKQTPGENYVVSTGGGIVERQENSVFMKHNGLVVYLDTSLAEIERRLGNDPSRPLWDQDKSSKRQLYKFRKNLYTALADVTIMTDQKSPKHIVTEILDLMK
ncbi:shikimate kinase [Lentibacillus sp.]|uniref:shikimate kinase n=1 Tax=Lentibacillus sp. TaxID=1925746 RepID=UPI002B4B20AB|nr:shikimate kinase [Lentibacillus sp.]HLS08047.1 shikimate kinase [Lentibacillus sp.]